MYPLIDWVTGFNIVFDSDYYYCQNQQFSDHEIPSEYVTAESDSKFVHKKFIMWYYEKVVIVTNVFTSCTKYELGVWNIVVCSQ